MHTLHPSLPGPTPPRIPLPLATTRIPAGFPSPATDYIEKLIDLNELLVKRKESTFFMRVGGVSMVEFGINDRDVVVVDRAAPQKNGTIVVARVDGELVLKKLYKKDGVVKLKAGNKAYRDMEFKEDGSELEIGGVVTHVVDSFYCLRPDRRQQLLRKLREAVRPEARDPPGDRHVEQRRHGDLALGRGEGSTATSRSA